MKKKMKHDYKTFQAVLEQEILRLEQRVRGKLGLADKRTEENNILLGKTLKNTRELTISFYISSLHHSNHRWLKLVNLSWYEIMIMLVIS